MEPMSQSLPNSSQDAAHPVGAAHPVDAAHLPDAAHHDDTLAHTRITDTLLGGAEKKALHWLAAHMPAWVVPDTLTMIGLGASVLIFISYALTAYNPAFLWLASLGFVINWFGDSLDGTLARYRHIERPRYGFFVDHIIDSASEVLVFIGLGLSPYLRFDLALLALISYLLMATYVYLVTYVNGVFRISFGRLGPTESRALGILANTLVFFSGNISIHLPAVQLFGWSSGSLPVVTIYDVVAVVFMLLAVGFFAVNSISTAMSLSKEDRAAARARSRQEKARRAAQRQIQREERALRSAMAREKRQKASAARVTRPLTNRT